MAVDKTDMNCPFQPAVMLYKIIFLLPRKTKRGGDREGKIMHAIISNEDHKKT